MEREPPAFERYAEQSRRVLAQARHEAAQLGAETVQPEHLLLGLLRVDEMLLALFLSRSAATFEAVRAELNGRAGARARALPEELPFGSDVLRILAEAVAESERLGDSQVAPEHIVFGLLSGGGQVAEWLAERGLRPEALRDGGVRWLKSYLRVLLARHRDRPHALDLITRIFDDYVEVAGDRRFADDPAIVCGMARFHGLPVVVVGQQKGRDTNQRRQRNFGMPKPEGYRKALRVMRLAEKFGRPIFTFIDTPGAYPGIDAEERGQAEAIAFNLREMARLRVPSIVTVIGEGGSGGALAVGVGDCVLMLENAIYSVISPEGCAAILWKDAAQAARAAGYLRLTAQELFALGVIDKVVMEPAGGAHTAFDETARRLAVELSTGLAEVMGYAPDQLLGRRAARLRALGRCG